jgi:hypothetical protein
MLVCRWDSKGHSGAFYARASVVVKALQDTSPSGRAAEH